MIFNTTNQYLLKIQVHVTMIPNFTNKEQLSGSMLERGKSMEARQQQLLGGMGKRPLLNMVDSFSLHPGLKINFEKTEVLFLGNDQKSTTETVISLARNRNITAKKAIKILGKQNLSKINPQ